MDLSKHTVTLPMEEYTKLIKASDLSGIEPIKPGSPIYDAFVLAAHEKNIQMSQLEPFFRIKK